MKQKQYTKLGSIFCLVLLIVELVAACAPAPAPSPSTAPSQIILTRIFPPGYVIVVGIQNNIDTVLKTKTLQQFFPPEPKPVHQLSLLYLDPHGGCPIVPAFPAPTRLLDFKGVPNDPNSVVVMDLYGITSGPSTVSQVIAVAQAINDAGESLNLPVYADPVYRTSSGFGRPWTGGGSPYDFPEPEPDGNAFLRQWAFGNTGGIGLVTSGTLTRTVSYTGAGVRVGVFDTSPFTTTSQQAIDWLTPTLKLQVMQPSVISNLENFLTETPSPNESKIKAAKIQDHGLFVAGLIHAVAPDSDIHLYRVLNQDGQGHLWTLNVALDMFISQVYADRKRDPTTLRGAVINLSLGAHLPQGWREFGLPVNWKESEVTQEQLGHLPADAKTLRTLIQAAYCQGIVVVAASGNDSASSATAQGAQFPAAATQAIAVAASSLQCERSCFSNQGIVAAPGGNGDKNCHAAYQDCQRNPEYCIVGPVSKSNDFQSGYAYWAGTSFSTPLVSGLAALIRGKEGWPTTNISDTIATITTGACRPKDSSPPIINVPLTLLGPSSTSCP